MTTLCGRQALATADRLLDPAVVLAAAPGPTGASLAGLAGTALLHARLSSVDGAFAVAAARHWEACATHAHGTGPTGGGIFGSSQAGLAASLILGSPYLPDPDSQQLVTARAARWLAARSITLTHAQEITWSVYDVINGLAGLGRVLLAAVTSGHDAAEPGLLAALRMLTKLIHTNHGERPGWWLPAHAHPATVKVDLSGVATTGMAHGIAGPVSFLAVAHTQGWSVPGQTSALRSAAHWLLRWRTEAHSWAPHVTGDELDTHSAASTPGRRDAWCYGAPGIGRALTLAGAALADPALTTAGDLALASIADRPPIQWDCEGSTLCHGYAGVLQCGADKSAAAAVTAEFDPQLPFTFRHTEKDLAVDRPGLLTGAAGVALALADHGQLPAPSIPTRWDCLLALS